MAAHEGSSAGNMVIKNVDSGQDDFVIGDDATVE